MKAFWKMACTSLVLVPLTCAGIVGCGSKEPEVQKGDFNAADIDAAADAEAQKAARLNPAAPNGEPGSAEGP